MLDRLAARGATREFFAERFGFPCVQFNAAELAPELDALGRRHGLRALFSARCVDAIGNAGTAALIEDKSGRRAIAIRSFVDASGNGDLLRRTGFAAYQHPVLQSVTMQALVTASRGLPRDVVAAIDAWADEFAYPRANGFP